MPTRILDRRRWRARARARLEARRGARRQRDRRGARVATAIGAEPRVRSRPASIRSTPAASSRSRGSAAVELVVIGPEAPLAAGLADALDAAGVPFRAIGGGGTDRGFEVVLPRGRRGGRRSDGPRPIVRRPGRRRARARLEAGRGGGVVVKADGLAAGKGVIVCLDRRRSGGRGGRPWPAPVSGRVRRRGAARGTRGKRDRDLRRQRAIALPVGPRPQAAGDGDLGPNTGGMGAYSPLPDLSDDAVDEIVRDGPPATPRRARAAGHAVPRLPLRGPDADRRRAAAARVQRAPRRPGGPGDPAAAGRCARSAAARRGPWAPRRWRRRPPAGPAGASVGIVLAAAGYPEAPLTAARSRGSRRRGPPVHSSSTPGRAVSGLDSTFRERHVSACCFGSVPSS